MPIYRSARHGSTQHSPQYHLQPLMQGHCHRVSTPCRTLQDIVFNHWCKTIVPIETRARGEWSPIPDRPYRYNYANHSCLKLVHRSWRFLYSVTIRIPKSCPAVALPTNPIEDAILMECMRGILCANGHVSEIVFYLANGAFVGEGRNFLRFQCRWWGAPPSSFSSFILSKIHS